MRLAKISIKFLSESQLFKDVYGEIMRKILKSFINFTRKEQNNYVIANGGGGVRPANIQREKTYGGVSSSNHLFMQIFGLILILIHHHPKCLTQKILVKNH